MNAGAVELGTAGEHWHKLLSPLLLLWLLPEDSTDVSSSFFAFLFFVFVHLKVEAYDFIFSGNCLFEIL